MKTIRDNSPRDTLAQLARRISAETLPAERPSVASVVAISVLLGLTVARALMLDSGAPPGRVAAPPAEAVFQLDLNRCDPVELTLLPGIGPVMAQRIVDFRGRCGPFQSPDQLLDVQGIGPKTLQRIRPFLRVAPVPDGW